jgi:hypothetical protein
MLGGMSTGIRRVDITHGAGVALLCAMVGIVMTVASAWSVQLMRPRTRALSRVQGSVREWPREVPADWKAPYIRVDSNEPWSHLVYSAGVGKTERFAGMPARTIDVVLEEVQVGVPFRCLASWTLSENPPVSLVSASEVHGSMLIRRGLRLPVCPLWPGFALNVGCYGLIAWGVWRLPLVMRRRGWRRRGMCVRCGYDRSGILKGAKCPECGCVPS